MIVFALFAAFSLAPFGSAQTESCLARLQKADNVKRFLSGDLLRSVEALDRDDSVVESWVWPLHARWREASQLDPFDLQALEACLTAPSGEAAAVCTDIIRTAEQSLNAFATDVNDVRECALPMEARLARVRNALEVLLQKSERLRLGLMPHFLQLSRRARSSRAGLLSDGDLDELKRQADAALRCQSAKAELEIEARRQRREAELKDAIARRLREMGC